MTYVGILPMKSTAIKTTLYITSSYSSRFDVSHVCEYWKCTFYHQ